MADGMGAGGGAFGMEATGGAILPFAGGSNGSSGTWKGKGGGWSWGWNSGYNSGGYTGGWHSRGSWSERSNALRASIREALLPVAHMDTSWTIDEMENRIFNYFSKASSKFIRDDRPSQRGSSMQAQALIEEFVESVMGAVSAGCYDKQWFPVADFSGPLFQSAKDTFGTGKLFYRMVGPDFRQSVDDALFHFKEEERISKELWKALEKTPMESGYRKKALQHLQKAFDEAHVSASYNSSQAASAELQMLQDFVKGWIVEFVTRAWDVLQSSVPERDGQILFVATLFQQLVGPEMRCLPPEFARIMPLDLAPPPNWPWVAQATEAIFADEASAVNQRMRRRFMGAW